MVALMHYVGFLLPCIFQLQGHSLCRDALYREETGDFFAVDIGGTNFRVILVSLSEKRGEVVSPAFTCYRMPCSSRMHQILDTPVLAMHSGAV